MHTSQPPAGGGTAKPRVAIVHDFAEAYGGAERIAAAIAATFPDAPFYAIAGRREIADRMGLGDRFQPLLPESQWLLRNYRKLAPAYPALTALRRLPDADLLISSSYAFAHAFRTRNDAPRLCYCLSPLRFAWSMTDAYGERRGALLGRTAMRVFATPFRAFDRRVSRSVDRYLAESGFVALQLAEFYGRSADVVFPPVDCELFHPGEEPPSDYILFCGRLVEPYKRASLVIEAMKALPHMRLLIAGHGPARAELQAAAFANVEFLGALDDDELVPLMQRCSFAIFPSRDDFGLIPVEVMACGRPVLAFAGGGALETVAPGLSGELFTVQTATAVREAIQRFDPSAYDPSQIRRHAERWSEEIFRERIAAEARVLLAGPAGG